MRKIKLMALLLATLMIVSAFAGCAGVKKEELDALDVRVQALEDLLNGQQKDLEEIKKAVAEGQDNSDVLAAIDEIKKDLEDKIGDVDDRIEQEVGKETNGISDETKAAQQKALALIEVRRAEFNKVADEYSADDYTKISEALGTATGAVNAATTTSAVDAAMAALNAELGKYMTYAMKAYDYYTQLLGGVNADAADLVAEARAFLKEVKAVYEGKVEFTGTVDDTKTYKEEEVEAYRAQIFYLVEEGSSDAKDDYIDMYNAINTLCDLYVSTSTNKDDTDKVYIINAKGKVDFVELCSLAAYTRWAKSLVIDIDEAVGEELIYLSEGYFDIDDIYADYEAFVEGAEYLGGEKLSALVTNAAKIVTAEEQFKNLQEAAEDYDKATKLGGMDKADVFYYYKELVKAGAENKLEATLKANSEYPSTKDRKDVWVADEYEKVEEILADWVAEYELSEKNTLAIIKAKEGANFYKGATAKYTGDSYISDKLTNDLLVTAYNDFKAEIAEKIHELNGMANVGVPMVLAYDEIEDLFEDFLVLQEADKKADHPANLDIKIEYNAQNAVDNAVGNANMAVILRDSGVFTDLVEERVTVALANGVKGLVDTHLIDLYTFESDVYDLEAEKDDPINNTYFDYEDKTSDKLVDNREYGEVFTFFTKQYPHLRKTAKLINDQIEALDEAVEKFALSSNERFVILAGDYKKLEGSETYKAAETEEKFTAADNVYVLVDKLYTKDAEMDAYMKGLIDRENQTYSAKLTIKAFLYEYPEFEDLLDLDIFEAAKKTMDERMVTLFEQADQLVAEVDAIGYVRLTSGETYVDVNGDGKYTKDAEYFEDLNGNGVWDPAEPYVDVNGDDEYTAEAEEYVDANGNGQWDPAEPFTDLNENGKVDVGDSFDDANGNGVWDSGESFNDLNGNGKWDVNEPFADRNVSGYTDGEYDAPEVYYDDDENGFYTAPEAFTDTNGNGVWDDAEELTDLNGDGIWNDKDTFTDTNGDGVWTDAEPFDDVNGDGIWNDKDTLNDTNGNGKLDAGNDCTIYFDANGNGKYDKASSDFTYTDADADEVLREYKDDGTATGDVWTGTPGEEWKKFEYEYDDNGVDKKATGYKKVDQTVPYIVSLNDKADIDTAFATYTAWSAIGGALTQEIFTNYESEDNGVLDDVWVMAGLEEKESEVEFAVDMVHDLRYEIDGLESLANNFIVTVANVKAVDGANAITVSTDSSANTLIGNGKKNKYAWISYTASTHENAKDNDGSYKFVKTNGWELDTKNTQTHGTWGQWESNFQTWGVVTKQALLKKAVAHYDAFYTKHVEYIPDAANDYGSGKDIYYQRTDYVAYEAFDKAVTEYAKYDVLSVKGYLLGLAYTGVDVAVSDAFITLIYKATDLKTIENHIYTYLVYDRFGSSSFTFDVDALDPYAIYDFERLESLN